MFHFFVANQNPRLNPQKRRLDNYSVEVHSDHSDWEDSLLETDWMEATPVTGDCKGALERHSQDHLYMPPPPNVPDSSVVLPSSDLPSPGASASSVPSSSSTRLLSSMPFRLQLPSSTLTSSASTSASNVTSNVQPLSSEGSGSSVPLDVRPPASLGSESSDVRGSGTSLKNLSNAVWELSVSDTDNGAALSREEKILQDKQLAQSCLEKELVEQKNAQDWWQEKSELIQKDEELKRILDMPRAEMMKMISLRQEKEKLERKIR